MAILSLSSFPLPYQRACALSVISTDLTHANESCFSSSEGPLKLSFRRPFSMDSIIAFIPRSANGLLPPGLNCSLCTLLALGVCTINLVLPVQSASAEVFNRWTDEVSTAPIVQQFNPHSDQWSSIVVENIWNNVVRAEEAVSPPMETALGAERPLLLDKGRMSSKPNDVSLSQTEQPNPFLDYASLFSPAKAAALLNDINTLEAKSGWRLRVITKSGLAAPITGKDLKDLWKPDEKTVIVIEDISSPNILNFNAGSDVVAKLPRQFFLELQSRYGNQFFVQQEGEGQALTSTVQAIRDCLERPEGCKNVPGLTNDLYYLTLATSIAGGCVFGFAARLPPSGRVEASWQWVVFLSPLWLLLFVPFGILPVVGRTSELEPLVKNALGFTVGAFALYLTPIFGPSPISRN